MKIVMMLIFTGASVIIKS